MGGKRYSCNEECFDIDTPETFYWLGFIAADGYVIPDRNTFGVALCEKDVGHLEKLKDFMLFDGEIHYQKGTKSFLMAVYNKKVVSSLINRGITHRKSYTNVDLTDSVPVEYMNHWLSGYFDGDGSIFEYEHQYRRKDGTRQMVWGLNLMGNGPTMKSLIRYLNGYMNFNKLTYGVYPGKAETHKMIWSSKHDIDEFYKIYEKSPIHLERKMIKYKQYNNSHKG